MTDLLLSLLALVVGPLLVITARRARPTLVALDSFVLVVIGGLVITHVLPDSLGMAGLWVGPVALAGFLLPILAERVFHAGHGGMRTAVLALALLGMLVHTILDGMALGGHDTFHVHDDGSVHVHSGPGSAPLSWAVILHRIPVGIAIWWIVPRTLGVRAAVVLLAVTMVGTVTGWTLGATLLTGSSIAGAGLFQAFVAGSLLHVLMHAHVPPPLPGRRIAWPSVLGAAVAVATVAGILISHDHGPMPTGTVAPSEVFMSLALESAPALVVAYLLVGLSHSLLPAGWTDRLGSGSSFSQAVKGLLVGLPIPICSCGVVPLYRELVRKGTPVAAAMAFLIATPELEIAAFLLTWELMGTEIALTRVVMAAGIALLVATVLGRLAPRHPAPDEAAEGCAAACPPPEHRPRGVVRETLRFGFGEAVDNTGAWILLGLAVSALLVPFVDPELLAGLPAGVDVPIAALLGLPVYVCASGSTPLAAVLVAQGLSPGAGLAFLITGPATNATTFGLLRSLHGNGIALGFAGAMFVAASGAGLLANAVLPAGLVTASGLLDGTAGSPVQWAALVVLAVALLGSVLRMGVRQFVEQILEAPGSRAHAAGSPGF